VYLLSLESGERTLLFRGHYQNARFLNGGLAVEVREFDRDGGTSAYFFRPGMARAARLPRALDTLLSADASLLLTLDEESPGHVSYVRTADCDEAGCPFEPLAERATSDSPVVWGTDRAGEVALVIVGADAYVLTADDGVVTHVSAAASYGTVADEGGLVTWIEPSSSRLLAYDTTTKTTVVWSSDARLANPNTDVTALSDHSVLVGSSNPCTGINFLCTSSGCVDTWQGVAYRMNDPRGAILGVTSYVWCGSPEVLAEYRVTDIEGTASGAVVGDFLMENGTATRFLAWDTYAGDHEIHLYARGATGELSLLGTHAAIGWTPSLTWFGDALLVGDVEHGTSAIWDGAEETPIDRPEDRVRAVVYRDAPRAMYIQIGDDVYRRLLE
jgi:hypothetical protein